MTIKSLYTIYTTMQHIDRAADVKHTLHGSLLNPMSFFDSRFLPGPTPHIEACAFFFCVYK